MIKKLVRLYIINVFALWLVSNVVVGFHLAQGVRSLLIVGLGFTGLHLIIGPIIKTILGPINFLSLGLIGWVVDAGLLYILTIYFPQVVITPWTFPGIDYGSLTIQAIDFNFWASTFVASAVINIVRGMLSLLAE